MNKTITETRIIKRNANSAITWILCEDGAGNLSMAFYRESKANLECFAVLPTVRPQDVKGCINDLEMINMWEGVEYDKARIEEMLSEIARDDVASTGIAYCTGDLELTIQWEKMGYAAREALAFLATDDDEEE